MVSTHRMTDAALSDQESGEGIFPSPLCHAQDRILSLLSSWPHPKVETPWRTRVAFLIGTLPGAEQSPLAGYPFQIVRSSIDKT